MTKVRFKFLMSVGGEFRAKIQGICKLKVEKLGMW